MASKKLEKQLERLLRYHAVKSVREIGYDVPNNLSKEQAFAINTLACAFCECFGVFNKSPTTGAGK